MTRERASNPKLYQSSVSEYLKPSIGPSPPLLFPFSAFSSRPFFSPWVLVLCCCLAKCPICKLFSGNDHLCWRTRSFVKVTLMKCQCRFRFCSSLFECVRIVPPDLESAEYKYQDLEVGPLQAKAYDQVVLIPEQLLVERLQSGHIMEHHSKILRGRYATPGLSTILAECFSRVMVHVCKYES